MSWSQARDRHVPVLTARRRPGKEARGLGTLVDFILRETKRHEQSSAWFSKCEEKNNYIYTCVNIHVN